MSKNSFLGTLSKKFHFKPFQCLPAIQTNSYFVLGIINFTVISFMMSNAFPFFIENDIVVIILLVNGNSGNSQYGISILTALVFTQISNVSMQFPLDNKSASEYKRYVVLGHIRKLKLFTNQSKEQNVMRVQVQVRW